MPYKDKNKQREYQKEWMKKRRSEFFSDKCCHVCGSTKDLELHHTNKLSKKEHRIWSWSKKKRDGEIKKCIILCRQCHIELHAAERKRAKHGTDAGYMSGCRCVLCKKAHYLRAVEYKERLKIKSKTGVLPEPPKILVTS